ncbi:hypothetical protein RBSH_04431 [Rhodopirellula baltica SH28]|uniref:Uncharacterized protein n=1 Tax=Rhodopirellula baltica SH28 TaxID=993517 RepID=K5E3E0_RHOBT|nr:hypothetical protein RBSH_04431 [Rhodopirellula baltica SH28]
MIETSSAIRGRGFFVSSKGSVALSSGHSSSAPTVTACSSQSFFEETTAGRHQCSGLKKQHSKDLADDYSLLVANVESMIAVISTILAK